MLHKHGSSGAMVASTEPPPQCCFKCCDKGATTHMREGPRPGRTFTNGAGWVCDTHATECKHDGCIGGEVKL